MLIKRILLGRKFVFFKREIVLSISFRNHAMIHYHNSLKTKLSTRYLHLQELFQSLSLSMVGKLHYNQGKSKK